MPLCNPLKNVLVIIILNVLLPGCATYMNRPHLVKVTEYIQPSVGAYEIGQVYEILVDVGYDRMGVNRAMDGPAYVTLTTLDTEPPRLEYGKRDIVPAGTRIRIADFYLESYAGGIIGVLVECMGGPFPKGRAFIAMYAMSLRDGDAISLRGVAPLATGPYKKEIETEWWLPKPNPKLLRLVSE